MPHVGLLGLTGFGKTTRLRARIHSTPRVVAIDPVVTAERPRGQLHLPHRFWRGDECARWILDHPHPRVLRCALHSRDPRDFALVSDALFRSGGHAVLAVDEIRILCSGRRGEPDPWLAFWLSEGRNYDVQVWWTSQFPQQVHQVVTSQSEHLEVFRITELAQLAHVRPRFRAADFNAIPRLDRFEYVSSEE